jgi:hypothetical protein
MFRWRSILYALILLPRVLADGADASDALERYNGRLDEISRSYKQKFGEIRKNQRRIGSEKVDFRAGEQQIKELGMMRSAAIAEAKLIYKQGQKQTDPAPVAKPSREERQRVLMAARRQFFEDGQKAFWTRAAQEEPKIAELMAARRQAIEGQQTAFWAGLPFREAQMTEVMAARRQAVEEAQTAFWAGLFEVSRAIPRDQPPVAAGETGARLIEKQQSPRPQHKDRGIQVQYGPALAAAH